MQVPAAVLWAQGAPWKIETVELDAPHEGEVLVKLAASGLCHSDDHVVTGDTPCAFPMIGGHEGAGVVEAVGPGVTRTAVGDHVILAAVPACGQCRACSRGRANLCDRGAFALTGHGPDGTYRRHIGDTGIGAYCQIGTFSPYVVAHETQTVPIRRDVPLELAALIGCGVTTGVGAAVKVGRVQIGDIVVVVGIGGVGINAVQGALLGGAATVVAVDPVARKRDWALQFGAHHAVSSMAEATELVGKLTDGAGADLAILCVGVAHGDMVGPLLGLIAKGGRAVVTSVAPVAEENMSGRLFELAMWNKTLSGHVFGQANPIDDFPRTVELYRCGAIKLEELVTARYTLDEINEGYRAMHSGENLRGIIVYD
ncbi:NDMA-dependent alcohol dehydrogenase [Nocardia sp. NPDC052278]|uniref:NDMA-dependent alcohol dehydrogenase n=1 Tax=unclassified Nocardia TaxID=2637762 RepID=UPI00369BDA04